MLNELIAPTVRPRFFWEAKILSDPARQIYDYLRRWTDITDVTWNSQTWTADNFMYAFSDYSEKTGSPQGMDIELLGEASALVSIALQGVQTNLPGKLYFGFLDSAGAIIDAPFCLFSGRLSDCELRDSATASNLTLRYESATMNFRRECSFRYNDATQKSFFSTDRGFEYVEQLATGWHQFWGKEKSSKGSKN